MWHTPVQSYVSCSVGHALFLRLWLLIYINSVCISSVLVIAVFAIYKYGPTLRKNSPFATQLSEVRAETDLHGNRLARLPTGSRANSFARSQQNLRLRQVLGSRQNSYAGSRLNSRANSRVNSRVNSRRNSHADADVELTEV
jgi:hypothetical protein